MQSAFDVEFEEPREFVTIGDSPGPFGKILKDHPRVIGAAKKSAIDAVGAAFHDGAGNPHERNTKDSAESHAELRIMDEELREKAREKKNGQQGSTKQQKEITALHKDVASAAAKEHGNFEDAMFDDGVSKREGIEKKEKCETNVNPEGSMVAEQVDENLFENDRQDTQQDAP